MVAVVPARDPANILRGGGKYLQINRSQNYAQQAKCVLNALRTQNGQNLLNTGVLAVLSAVGLKHNANREG